MIGPGAKRSGMVCHTKVRSTWYTCKGGTDMLQVAITRETVRYSLLALNFIVPFVMVWVGHALKKHPVTDMDSQNGYCTPTSQKSQEHWDYAQSIAPDIFLGLGKVLGIAEIFLNIVLFVWKVPVNVCVTAGITVGILVLVLAFYRTEKKIKHKFEKG